VADALAWHGLSDELRAHRVVTDWRDIVGARIAQRAWPDGLTRSGRGDAGARVLWIRVSSSAWLHELTLLKAQLTATIRDALGEPALFDEIRFHLGARAPDPTDALAGIKQRAGLTQRRRPPPSPATGDRRAAIEAETDRVTDGELRALIRGVRIRNDR
jgi:hypothetical protein